MNSILKRIFAFGLTISFGIWMTICPATFAFADDMTDENEPKTEESTEQQENTQNEDVDTGHEEEPSEIHEESGSANGESNSEEPSEEITEESSEEATEKATEEPTEDVQEDRRKPVDDEIKDVMKLEAWLDGDDVIIIYKTKHSDPWDYHYQANPIEVNYEDGHSSSNNNRIDFDWDGFGIHGDSWSSINGSSISKYSDQDDTETAEIRIPQSWFESLNFTLCGGGYETSINGENNQHQEEESSDEMPVYEGIVIDGNFSDWDAVEKYDLIEPDGDDCVECVAWMIEDDFVYIYIKDTGTNSATWAGPNHNGKFAITTDLGRTLVLQLNDDGMVTGADGIDSVHNGSQWEISIPIDMIPQNNGGLDFGLYLYDSSLSGQAESGNAGSNTGIEYDGIYGDWDNYPHKEIQYSTAGTNENVPDGEAAIYFDNMIYGHCVTQMQAHLDERGGEYTQGVTIFVNDDFSHALEMRLASVDDDGNINWNPDRWNLDDGTYEYYIFATDCWGSSKNIGNLVKADVCYGKFAITIRDDRQDAEWYIEPEKLAERYGYDVTDMKTISSRYIRIGSEAVTTAGTSTGPVGSSLLISLFAGIPWLLKKKGELGI